MDIQEAKDHEGDIFVRDCGRALAVRSATGGFSEDTWTTFLRAIDAHDLDSLRILVRTDGAAPSGSQLRSFVKMLGGRAVPVAIVTNEGRVRFVASALAMMTRRIRSFNVAELDAACRFLELTPEEAQRVMEFVQAAAPSPAHDARGRR